MKSHPIIFSDFVWAILDGRKTQTRRVVKKLPDCIFEGKPCCHSWPAKRVDMICSDCWKNWMALCPYTIGDRLWVKEAWQETPNAKNKISYRESWTDPCPPYGRWRSSRFMPCWASRITLEITDVRVQRVQEISERDAIAEGMLSHVAPHSIDKVFRGEEGQAALKYFKQTWDKFNAKRGYPWESNPWVWAITFRRVEDKK